MTAASEALGVTHSAVSRQVKYLEERLGVSLFVRTGVGIEPTREALGLSQSLSVAFEMITASLEQLEPGPVNLSCCGTMMMFWLLPRIDKFQTTHPHVELQLDSSQDRVDLSQNATIAIRDDTTLPPRDFVRKPMLREWIGPVCSPEYLAKHGPLEVRDLSRHRLLATTTRKSAWDEWLSAVEVQNRHIAPTECFEHFYLLIQAAACHLGVAIAPHMLVANELRSGRLVAPFGFAEGPREMSLWIAQHLANRPDTKAVVNWLTSEFKATSEAQKIPTDYPGFDLRFRMPALA